MDSTLIKTQISTNEGAGPLDVELRQLFKVFDGEPAVNGVNLQVRQGEFFSILGPSGCGKTTLLRMIAGFETPSAGDVLIQSQRMNRIPPYRRPVNTVFQSYALFNHLTVAENIAFGLKIRKVPRIEREEQVRVALAGVQMEKFAQRYPNQLSGGQRQRVALARALVNRPAVVLLDEPLGALDLKLRKEMQVELSRLHRELGLTFVMVTHDQEEALSLSDRIAVVRAGQIEQVGTPNEIYQSPQTAFVADFIGDTNLFVGDRAQVTPDRVTLVTHQGLPMFIPPLSSSSVPVQSLSPVRVSIRPEKIHLSLEPQPHWQNCYEGRLRYVMYLGTRQQYGVELVQTGETVIVMQPGDSALGLQPDREVFIGWSAGDCVVLER
ncbi:ABC transporter ATP-binding protein [Spirulina subsalsa FACHB-351]|uniref:Spermidine/putrescine import ATP-binding protein PotA n=1 Tax=Spirulina subsalsa FACHB-351 TaxID=234711 RepID=A0ABT3LAS5_9CYAN|nr:ABC transporter ATP-binding protein [Spirulina subsalsa]MCW6038598.1 ABC transporter ATP-binding protein [Spirulina subsalsa FACHB-351]